MAAPPHMGMILLFHLSFFGLAIKLYLRANLRTNGVKNKTRNSVVKKTFE
jgi:hypothetical protein